MGWTAEDAPDDVVTKSMAESSEDFHADLKRRRPGVEGRHTSSGQPIGNLQATRRESQIIGLICRGLSDKEIAAALNVTPRTVSTHLERLFRRNGIHKRAAAVSRWFGASGGSGT
jgi:DNA-binding NarL/FixJ family response regulator